MTTEETTDEYLWLTKEMALVQTKKYFVVDASPNKDADPLEEKWRKVLPGEYTRFVERFGNAMLYRQHIGYGLGVMAPPLEVETKQGERLLQVGHFLDRLVYFKTDYLHEHTQCPVFEGQAGGLVLAAEGFAAWLQTRAALLRSRIGKKQWEEIVAGPPPFSHVERQIIEARSLYEWKNVGVQANGDIGIEVTNGSTRSLPFLTLSVKTISGNFNGRVWLPVADIVPGETKLVTHECYKKQLPRESVQLFDLGEPSPEDREHFWEFRASKAK